MSKKLLSFYNVLLFSLFSVVFLVPVSANELARFDRSVTAYNRSMVEKYHPMFDFDGDGCYPATPFDRYNNLSQNPGLSATGTPQGKCADSNFGQFANTLHRQLCHRDYGDGGWNLRCAHFYELYFEKDQAVGGSFLGGHRHDVETVIIWTGQVWKDNGQYNEFVSHVSTSAHGHYTTKHYSEVQKHWGHPLIVYHKDGAGTHAFRHANANDKAHVEFKGNWGEFYAPDIISYYSALHWWTSDEWDRYRNNKWFRDTLRNANFGSASFKTRDEWTLMSQANDAMPRWDPFWANIQFTWDDVWFTRGEEFKANYPNIYRSIEE